MSKENAIYIESDDVKIEVTGKSNQLGGLDLQVKAITSLIEMIDYKFAESKDPEIRQKVALQILDSLGSCIKYDMIGFSNRNKKNIEVTQEFINWIINTNVHKQPEYAAFLDKEEQEC
jgi:hypothetical protein